MAELHLDLLKIRSYEVSIWTLQDRFLSVLKWAIMDQKGQIQDPEVILRDDGTQEFSFTIPQFYTVAGKKIPNPMWIHLNEQPLEANMHKLKVIFNKNTEEERVFEFLVVSMASDHSADEIDITVKAEGLAFHELGKTGYKVNISQENFEQVEDEWFENPYDVDTGERKERPLMNLQFWNDLIFKDTSGEWRTNWIYEIQMNWSAFSNNETTRHSDILYEDAYISSWQLNGSTIKPRAVESLRQKERPVEISESNYYNATQTIAEQFGVFCRYEYEHNERYEITGRKIVYYNNYIKDAEGHIDLTYPYSSQAITRTSDNTELTTRLFVKSVDDEQYGTISIMDVEANKIKEDYLLNFDYLIKIGAINEDQVEALKKFEADVRFLNELLISNQERIRIVKNQLIDVSANVTYYTNAIKLDDEQLLKATNLRNAITSGTGYVPYNRSHTVMDGTEYGYGQYINISVEGLDINSLRIYDSRVLKDLRTGMGYSDPILSYEPVEDEFDNVIRIQHLSRPRYSDDNEIYLVGQYSPGSYYDKVIEVWKQRKAIDERKLKEAQDEEARLNWYLYGSRVGYAIVDGSLADGEYSGIAMVWDNSYGPLPEEGTRQYNQYIDYTLDARVISDADVDELSNVLKDGDISKLAEDFFYDDDAEYASPDLLYYFELYSKQKEKIVNSFERMMGPAIREGYWQPENYNDYGDVYYDNFIINNTQPSTPYLNFIWDNEKYYESEEPLVYTNSAAGTVSQHLIINLSNYMPQIKDHLDDLFFAYHDPITFQTIQELKQKIMNISGYGTQESDKMVDVYDKNTQTIFDAEYVSPQSLYQAYLENKPTLGILTAIEEQHELLTDELKGDNNYGDRLDEIIEAIEQLFEDLSPATERATLMTKNNDKIIDEQGNEILVKSEHVQFVDASQASFICADNKEFYVKQRLENSVCLDIIEEIRPYVIQLNELYTAAIKQENIILNSINDSSNYPPHAIGTSNTVAPQHLEQLQNEQKKISKILTLVDKSLSWCQYISGFEEQIEAISNKKNGYYHTYGINADCEFGWIIDNEGDENVQIPVLIVTGTDTLSSKVLSYIQNGSYTYKSGITDEGNNQIYHTIVVPDGVRIMIGYYNSILGASNEQYIEKLIHITPEDFIGDASEVSLIKIVDDRYMPIEVEDYRYQRVYPRLYFSTLKLRDGESKLRVKLNEHQLVSNEDYYLINDDRSVGLKSKGIGYYLTIRPSVIYPYLCDNELLSIEVMYTLLNADTSIYLDAIQVAKENAFPKVSYEVELSVLNPSFVRTAYDRLNQIVYINDTDLKLEEVSGYISSITMKLDRPWEDTVEIKNYQTKFEDLFSTIVAQTEAMKKSEAGLSNAVRAFTATGFIDGEILQDSLLKTDLSLAFNKGKLTITQNEGILGDDGSGGLVAFRGGGIFTSNSTDANGNRIWNTGILPSGINADLITSGQLNTNRIKIYAGEEIRFQLNSEGLFAYKEYSTDDEELAALMKQDEPENGVDKLQYVVYNTEGLFLTAKAGTYHLNTGDDGSKYIKSTKDVNRVEVSWDGFILRNWDNEKVFYADPDTGDLYLTGIITATGGKIAGWTISNNGLFSDTINLISQNTVINGQITSYGGIYLTASSPTPNVRIFNNSTYYEYQYNYNGDLYTCYCNTRGALDVTFVYTDNDNVGIIQQKVVGQKPKYIIEVSQGNANMGIYTYIGTDENTILEYVDAEDGLTKRIQWNGKIYKKDEEKPENLTEEEWAEKLRVDLEWYNILKEKYENTYEQYLTDVTEEVLAPAPNLTVGMVLSQVNFKPTFSVKSADGYTTINKGKIGSFTITNDGLTGTEISSGVYSGSLRNTELGENNYIMVDGQKIPLGTCFYDCYYDTTQGALVLKQLNGSTKSITISQGSTIPDSGQPQPGENCNGNCDTTCLSDCASGCGNNCYDACSGSCGTNCNQQCSTGCAFECGKKCASSCYGSCSNSCTGSCRGASRGGGCFAPGTLITLYDRTYKRIEDIHIGDSIIAYNTLTKQFEEKKISNTHHFENTQVLAKVIFNDDTSIIMTPGHPILSTNGWKSLDLENSLQEHLTKTTLLEVGDIIIGIEQNKVVKQIIQYNNTEHITVYNATTEDYHTFVANGIVVHNAKSVT